MSKCSFRKVPNAWTDVPVIDAITTVPIPIPARSPTKTGDAATEIARHETSNIVLILLK
ncbi:MAG: hypothetical protein PWR17_557 [Candidatus Methanomethylophilaceae archaeon]|nr:hypothetical protein [Candidatus Methanomethylophilaceae archaeon]